MNMKVEPIKVSINGARASIFPSAHASPAVPDTPGVSPDPEGVVHADEDHADGGFGGRENAANTQRHPRGKTSGEWTTHALQTDRGKDAHGFECPVDVAHAELHAQVLQRPQKLRHRPHRDPLDAREVQEAHERDVGPPGLAPMN